MEQVIVMNIQIEAKPQPKKATILNTNKSARKRALSSLRSDATQDPPTVGAGSLKDYNKLILGLEYALEGERNKNEEMKQKNQSL